MARKAKTEPQADPTPTKKATKKTTVSKTEPKKSVVAKPKVAPKVDPVIEKKTEPSAKRRTLLEEVEAERIAMAESAKIRKNSKVVAKSKEPESLAPQERPKARKKPEPVVPEVAAKSPKKRIAKPVKKQKSTTSKPTDSVGANEALPIPTWRKPQPIQIKSIEAPIEDPQDKKTEEPFSARKSKSKSRLENRKERDQKSKSTPREVTEEIESAEEIATDFVSREPIAVPENAAQVAVVNGIPTILYQNEIIPPLFFFASAMDESSLNNALEQIKLASENDIHLFSLLVELEVNLDNVNESVSFAAFLMKRISTVDSQAKFIFRTVFVAPEGWEKTFPKAKYVNDEGEMGDPSLCDDEFWNQAEECLTDYIQKLVKLDTKQQILGVHLERGEWFFSEKGGYDRSESARSKYQQWLRHRYRNDLVSLRAAWFNGSVDFNTINIPEYRDARSFGSNFVRTDRKSRSWVDFNLFLSDSTCERIASLAYCAKKASGARFLVGTSYGYTFEWSHPASGHLSLGKLLRCRELDYIGGPPSYKNREPGGSAPFPVPIDSFPLNGKLYISEDDFKTPISGQREPDDFNPVMKTPQALGNVHWRGAGSALAHCSGACWMDSWGNGWLNSRGIWERAHQIKEALQWRIGTSPTSPDAAVFVDERSLAYLIDHRAFEALVQNVRESIMRSGLSVGFYLLSDLAHRENFPDCKLHVFVNAWDIRPEVRSAIKTRLQKDGKVLFWLYSAGLFEGGRESLERVREVTGIALRPQPFNSKTGTTILNARNLLCQNLPEQAMASGGNLEPSYFAIPEDGEVLGEYSQSGLPSFVSRKFENDVSGSWTSIFMGEPVVSPGLFRSLGQAAGAHVWNFQNDVVHVRDQFLTIHCTGTSPRTIALPDKFVAYNLIEGEFATTEGNGMKFQGMDGSTYSFLVGTRPEVDALLQQDAKSLLSHVEIQSREDNTLHWDVMRFDVPIMKLDEWVEETWSEDLADDLLLKPSMLDVEDVPLDSEAPQRSRGQRRRKRRSSDERRDRGSQDDGTINFMFRKKE